MLLFVIFLIDIERVVLLKHLYIMEIKNNACSLMVYLPLNYDDKGRRRTKLRPKILGKILIILQLS